MKCSLCPRQCNSERTETENLNGYCKMPLLPKVARAQLHFWEEPIISGTNGSGTVFFSGCPISCVYCQNYSISQEGFGKVISYERLAEIFETLEKKGAHNINLVSPSHYVYAIKKALGIYKPKIPIVYNSGGYDLPQTIKELKGIVDIFLFDLKYLSNDRAQLYSNAYNYPEVATQAIKESLKISPEAVIKDGIMQKGVIIRHLLLPQGTNEAIKVFDWVRQNANGAYFSIMSQYVPYKKAQEMPVINRKITKREYDKVIDYISNTDFKNVFIQENTSANTAFIPNFNLDGV